MASCWRADSAWLRSTRGPPCSDAQSSRIRVSSSGLPAQEYTAKWNSRFRSGVTRVVVAHRAHLVIQRLQPGQVLLVDLPRGQRGAQRLQGGADLEVLLDRAVVRLHHGEAPVGVADDQAFGFEPPHRLADRGLADVEPLGQVALAQLHARRASSPVMISCRIRAATMSVLLT